LKEVLVAPDDFLLQANSVLEGNASPQTKIDLFDALQDCLDKLDQGNRDLFARRFGFYGDPETWPQIAQATGTGEEAVKKRMQRLLPKLRECVQNAEQYSNE
jgi:DNA-directed RNA polymerase sigma subunit (sigma70/sigma32)